MLEVARFGNRGRLGNFSTVELQFSWSSLKGRSFRSKDRAVHCTKVLRWLHQRLITFSPILGEVRGGSKPDDSEGRR